MKRTLFAVIAIILLLIGKKEEKKQQTKTLNIQKFRDTGLL
jgi:hypothetical protein